FKPYSSADSPTAPMDPLSTPTTAPVEDWEKDIPEMPAAANDWKAKKDDGWKHNWKNFQHDWSHSRSGKVQHKSNFIGDLHVSQDYWELTPMNISHFIGDTELDLTRAVIP